MGSGFLKQKKQAKALQQQFSSMQNSVKEMVVTGESPNRLVTIKMNGEYTVLATRINPTCVDPEDVEGLEDLITAAFNDASRKISEEMNKLIPLSGSLF